MPTWRVYNTASYNELCDLEAEMLSMVCNDVETEPVLQEINAMPEIVDILRP